MNGVHTPSPTLFRDINNYLAFLDIAKEGREEVRRVTETRFVVINNTPGYLPEEDEPATFEDRASAVEYLHEEVNRYCEHLIEVDESFRVFWSPERDYAAVEHTDRTHDLGRVFEVLEAEEE